MGAPDPDDGPERGDEPAEREDRPIEPTGAGPVLHRGDEEVQSAERDARADSSD